MRQSCILARTDGGHVLLDSRASLNNTLPEEWRIISLTAPPSQPYHSHVAERNTSVEDTTIDSAHHAEVCEWLEKAIEQTREKWISTNAFNWSSYREESQLQPVETSSIELATLADADSNNASKAHSTDEERTQAITLTGDTVIQSASLAGALYLNMGLKPVRLCASPTEYLVPGRSGFLLADMSTWRNRMLQSGLRWDAIILDPPWRSKSASRSAQYREMDNYDLFNIDLPAILLKQALEKPCLIVTWVTNNPKHRRFVRDRLYPDWGISNVVEWKWVKITDCGPGDPLSSAGLPVWPLRGPSPRRCYEGLFIGVYNPFRLPTTFTELPDNKAFLAVPLGHSRKPNLRELLLPYLPNRHPYILEMFARSIPAGNDGKAKKGLWLSVGNEAIKYNEIGVHVDERGCL